LPFKKKSRSFGPGFAYFDFILSLISNRGVPGRACKIKAEKEEEKIINSGKRLHNYLLTGVKSRNRF
jgi:hypothetical protein